MHAIRFALCGLLVALLPFTASLTRPLARLEPVYQAEGAYLTIYRWSRQ